MFGEDGWTHVGYLRVGEYVDQSHVNSYESVVAYEPEGEGKPPFPIFDRDDPETTVEQVRADYCGVGRTYG
jgi:hypothetical protein